MATRRRTTPTLSLLLFSPGVGVSQYSPSKPRKRVGEDIGTADELRDDDDGVLRGLNDLSFELVFFQRL